MPINNPKLLHEQSGDYTMEGMAEREGWIPTRIVFNDLRFGQQLLPELGRKLVVRGVMSEQARPSARLYNFAVGEGKYRLYMRREVYLGDASDEFVEQSFPAW